jgi:hypothetical protein
MQKLSNRKTYTPTSTPLARGNCDSVLNSSEVRNSVQDYKTLDNNSEVVHSQHRGSSVLRVSNVVYVLNLKKEPLMPTTQQRANRLLREKKAKVVRTAPFTIQLTIATGEAKRPIVLGVDAGYENIGLSAMSEKKELLAAEVSLRKDIVKLISEKRMYRRIKRNRLWYRPSRFLNRRNENKGWLAPSIQNKLDAHLRIVEKIGVILPISKVIVEIAKFDIQKIQNAEIEGKEYQNGVQKDFENVKAYVRFRDGYNCQYCKKTDVPLKVHHLESRQTGSDRPENLISLCEKCHGMVHDGEIVLKIKKSSGYKPEIFMSTIYKRLVGELKKKYPNVEETFGYLTKMVRIDNGLEKSHIHDAFCIAGGKNQERGIERQIVQKRRNNRCLQIIRKGYERSVRRRRYNIQPKDWVWNGKEKLEVVGSYHYGTGIAVKRNKIKKNISVKRICKHFSRNGMLWNFSTKYS